MLCIRNLIADNNIDEAVSYLNEISALADNKQKYFDTGNNMINALLTDKNEKASASNTKIIFSGNVPANGIKNSDLCTVFANAVDNAVEACCKDMSGTEKTISIDSECRQGYLFLTVTNPCFDKVIFDDSGRIISSKADSEHHGFGISNIKNTVKKYSGHASAECRDDVFRISIDMHLSNSK